MIPDSLFEINGITDLWVRQVKYRQKINVSQEISIPRKSSKSDFRLRVARRQRIDIGEREVAGEEAAPTLFVFAFDDGEGRKNMRHVGGVRHAIKMEVKCIELRTAMRADSSSHANGARTLPA